MICSFLMAALLYSQTLVGASPHPLPFEKSEGLVTSRDRSFDWIVPNGDSNLKVRVSWPANLPGAEDYANEFDKDFIEQFRAFREWLPRLRTNLLHQRLNNDHPKFLTLDNIEIQSVDIFPRDEEKGKPARVGFMTVRANMHDNQFSPFQNRTVWLRGYTVGTLIILRPKDNPEERHLVFVEQFRPGIGAMRNAEIPAGMMDNELDWTMQAKLENMQETGYDVKREELIDMTKLFLKRADALFEEEDEEERPWHTNLRADDLPQDMFMSPGGLDEGMHILLSDKVVERTKIDELRNRWRGAKEEGELTRVRICLYVKCVPLAAGDAKTMAAIGKYEYAMQQGWIKFSEKEGRVVVRGTKDA